MSGRARPKSRDLDRSTSRHKKKKTRKHSSSASDDCVIVIPRRNSCSKDKRRKTEKKKRRRNSSNSSSSSNSIKRLKLVDGSRQLLGERPEFCRNGASHRNNSGAKVSAQGSLKPVSPVKRQGITQSRERTSNEQAQKQFAIFERRVMYASSNDKERSRKKTSKDLEKWELDSKKVRKSRKRRRSSSSSGSSRSTSCSSSSSKTSSSSSRDSSYERRRRRKKMKKKLAKKFKREKKRQNDEKRKMKKSKQKFKQPVMEIERSMSKMEHDRLLKDINVELADRARAMAPMTKEQWEKKQSVVRRVYDAETGRYRLIKGDGEVLEEIVSRDRHMEINRNATKGDGEFFQSRILVNK